MSLKEHEIDVLIIFIAFFSTATTLILSFIFPEAQITLLTILTVLLPVIYQVGNIYSKESIRAKNEEDYSVLEGTIETLENENKNLKEKVKEQSEFIERML